MLKSSYEGQGGNSQVFVRFHQFLNSMRFRILAAIIIMGLLPMLVMEHVVITAFYQASIRNKTNEVQHYLSQAVWEIGQKNTYIDDYTDIRWADLGFLSDVYDSRVLLVNSQMKIIFDSYQYEEGKILVTDSVVQGLQDQYVQSYVETNGLVELVLPIHSREDKVIGLIIAYINQGEFAYNMKLATMDIYVGRMIMLLAILVIAILFSGLLVEPIEKLKKAIQDFSKGIKHKLNNSDATEIQELTTEFNKLFGRMSVLEESRQEFVSNVSHELKTPMTSMKVLADALNNQKDVPIEVYQEFMQDIAKEVDRENKIITDLLTLVRMEQTGTVLNITSVEVNELMESLLRRISPIADQKKVEMIYESHRTVTADIDEVKITQAVTNIVENAIKYNHEGGWVKVILDADYRYFVIWVEDSGIGIPEEHLDKIFDRFYRVDKTRSRENGGTGLGLAIAHKIILMHRGQLQVHSKENEGSRFTIRIPLSYVEVEQNEE